jgi:hypothetical protein
MALSKLYAITVMDVESGADLEITSIPIATLQECLPAIGDELSPASFSYLTEQLVLLGFEISPLVDPPMGTIRGIIERILHPSSKGYGLADPLLDEVFETQLLMEASTLEVVSVAEALAEVMASAISSGSGLKAAIIVGSELSLPILLIASHLGVIAFGTGASDIFRELRKMSRQAT